MEEVKEGTQKKGRKREWKEGYFSHWSYFWCDKDVLHSEGEAVQLKECGEEATQGTQQ